MKAKALIIVGMHRSGTSAVSGSLAEQGVFMGDSLYGPQKGVNEKGFYENSALVRFNERLFDVLGWSWDDPLASCHQTFDIDALTPWIERGVALVKSEYGKHPYWGMKDPRTSLLLPFWHAVLEKADVEPLYIVMVRRPTEVAGSLAKRDGFSEEKSLMLWMNYTLSSMINTLPENRVVVFFDALMQNPASQMERVFDAADITPEQSGSSSFVDTRLIKQKSRFEPESELGKLSMSLFNVLDHSENISADVQSQYDSYCSRLSVVLVEHLRSVKQSEVFYRHLFFKSYRSIWWKLSLPVKKVEEMLRKIFNIEPRI